METIERSPSNTMSLPIINPDGEVSRYDPRTVLLTMIGVLLVMLLASLDQTIVGTAMPRILSELQGLDRYTWVTTSYLLTSTVMVPIYGKLSDLYGRKVIMMIALSLFLLGSALSGASQSMNELIAFRAFQGLGAGGLFSLSIAIIGDLFTPRERAKWQGVTGAVFGLSFILGPSVGGWITDHSTWRWVFYVNLPLGIAALFVLFFLMPTLHSPVKNAKVDFVGVALLIIGTVPLLLGFSWAGSQYDWISVQILGLFAVAIVGIVAFIRYEMNLEAAGGQPIIEPSLFKNRIFSTSIVITTLAGMAMFSSFAFIPLFVQGVIGTNATSSGVVMTPMMLTAITSSILSGFLVARLGRYKWIAITGTVIALLGAANMLRLDVHSTNNDVVLGMLILGLGMGFSLSLYNLVVQNALPTKIGAASAALTFFRQIGATIGLAAMGSVLSSSYLSAFNNAVPSSVKSAVPAQVLSIFHNPSVLLSPEVQAQVKQIFAGFGPQGSGLLSTLTGAVKQGMATSVHNVLLISACISLLMLVAVMFLPEIPLRGGSKVPSPITETEEGLAATEGGVSLIAGE